MHLKPATATSYNCTQFCLVRVKVHWLFFSTSLPCKCNLLAPNLSVSLIKSFFFCGGSFHLLGQPPFDRKSNWPPARITHRPPNHDGWGGMFFLTHILGTKSSEWEEAYSKHLDRAKLQIYKDKKRNRWITLNPSQSVSTTMLVTVRPVCFASTLSVF